MEYHSSRYVIDVLYTIAFQCAVLEGCSIPSYEQTPTPIMPPPSIDVSDGLLQYILTTLVLSVDSI